MATAKRKIEILLCMTESRGDSMASLGTVGGGRGAIIEMPSLLSRRDPSDFARSKKDKRVVED